MVVVDRVIRLRERRVERLPGARETHSLYDPGSWAIELDAGDVTESGTGERMRVVGCDREFKLGIPAEHQFDRAMSVPGRPTGDDIIKHAQVCDGTRAAPVQNVHGIGENRRVRVAGNQRLGCGPLGGAISPQQQSTIGLNVFRRKFQRMGDIVDRFCRRPFGSRSRLATRNDARAAAARSGSGGQCF